MSTLHLSKISFAHKEINDLYFDYMLKKRIKFYTSNLLGHKSC